MSTITKERVAEFIKKPLDNGLTRGEQMELARIALASLEAEAVAYMQIDGDDVEYNGHNEFSGGGKGVPLYTATPAPAPVNAEPVAWLWSHRKHPSEVTLVRPEDDELAEGAHWSGWSCQALYAAPPATVSVPAAMEIDDDFDSSFEHGKAVGWNAYRAAMLQGAEPVTMAYRLPEETGSLLQLRNIIRQRHAEWSQATFGDVGPVGPLKHLSKEALEAAAEPEDLSEWADMQFLLWDAQRRAGISDAEITAAMEDKLKINMERQWPEPKDGEPRLHIKEPGNSPVTPDGWVMVPKELTPEMMRAVQIRSELGGYATSNLSGAYNMFSEFWNVAVSAAPKVDDL